MANQAIAVLGAGCFWCVEAVFLELHGVLAVKSGYAGGHLANPSYKDVCTGTTGHAEVVQVTYDPDQIAYADLLRIFFTIHDPTTLNRQGADAGTQYRSAIFVSDQTERQAARDVMAEITAAHLYPNALVTTIEPLAKFWPAEAEHEDYFNRNPYSGYCQVVVAPKIRKFRKDFADRLKAKAA
jgi:peptide-methionine (S)-S-oxide reductase